MSRHERFRRRGGCRGIGRGGARWREPGGSGSEGSGGSHGAARRGRGYPAGLRGKEIGLFFARRGQAQRDWAQKNQKVAVSIDAESQAELRSIIQSIRSEESEGHERIDSINTVAMDYLTRRLDLEGLDESISGPLWQNPDYDRKLQSDRDAKLQSAAVRRMMEFRKMLPAYKMRQEIVDLIESNRVVVISGETGSGKTTQIPQFILDAYIDMGKGSTCKVICTQPRRISAIAVAERVAEERGERCGEGSAGYQIRLECRMPRERGSILFCTTGILLQQLQSDP